VDKKMNINSMLITEGIFTENFNRYDLLVKYYTIKQYLNFLPNSFNLYLKMQEARDPNRLNTNICIEIFKKYINFYLYYKGVNSRGIEVDIKPIPVADNNERMIGGSHRFTCSVYFGESEIAVEKEGKNWNKGVVYGKEWFEKNGFNVDNLELLNKIRMEIIDKRKITL